jgi:aminoglycoside phosphotransferase family enzyme/predicted kinase
MTSNGDGIAPNDQEAILRYLGSPETYRDAPVRRIDTHAASVFLAEARALKVKRQVRFPYLDYGTLEKRKRACEAELAVNRPFAPEIYRGVVAITRDAAGRLHIGGPGEAVEYAVEMARFDETRTLDHIADESGITPALADLLGRMVADAHRRIPPIDGRAWIAELARYIRQDETDFRAAPDVFAPEPTAALIAALRASLARLEPLLQARASGGYVRRGHGDLHLGNIALIGERPVLFDAIEFDDLIASGDVLYDLAFLLMDLVERGGRETATIVLNRYLTASGQSAHLDGLAALPFFMALRAAIRARVTLARLPRVPANEQTAVRAAAQNYFDLACGLMRPSAPVVIAIGGLSGTGKSAVARHVAPLIDPMPGAVILRSDVERKSMYGIAETEALPPSAYSPAVTEQVYAALAEKAGRVARAGHAVIVDAVFASGRERDLIRHAAQAANVAFVGVMLHAGLATRLRRIGARINDASDADATIARRQEDYDIGPCDWTMTDAGGTLDETARKVVAALAARNGRR